MKRNLFIYFRIHIIAGFSFLVLLTGCQNSTQSFEALPVQDRAAIAAQAEKTSHLYMMNRSQDTSDSMIPSQYWGDSISKLKPLRVVFDRVNIMIVMQEDWDYEQGYYVIPMISSYIPHGEAKFVEFKSLSVPEDSTYNSIYYYKMQKENFTDFQKGIKDGN